jgi:uncharacterized protein
MCRACAFLAAFLIASPWGYAQDFLEPISQGSVAQVATAIAAGAKLDQRSADGRTALMWAASSNEDPAVISELLKAGAVVDDKDQKGRTALMLAAAANPNSGVAEVLLKGGADAKKTSRQGKTALDYAGENERLIGTDVYWHLNDASY